MDLALKQQLGERLGERLAGPIRQRHDQTEIQVTAAELSDVVRTLHDDPALDFAVLADVTGVDTGTTLQAVYHLWSRLYADWLRVIAIDLPRDDPRVPSVTGLWPGSEWMEREAYDMFGLIFEGNRDLRRIYMPPDYASFPLRKDFFLPDDAARSPGAGVRHMEQTHVPRGATPSATVRRTGN